ncbi:lysosomal Pro-Xaa carboxypeptidase [Ranunculus cassubicifolius]
MSLKNQISYPSLRWMMIAFFVISYGSANVKPRLGASPWTNSNISQRGKSSLALVDGMKTFYYTQTLDHFNYRPDSHLTFQQRYVINSRYWGGVNTSSPIFVHLGAENSVEDDFDTILIDWAPQFNALIVFIEHRYYGKSMPFGSRKEAFSNTTTLGYFNAAQALADYAEVIVNLKKNFSAQDCPIIVVGESYGGMLAAWFRLKYPHIAFGALASSAPIYMTARKTLEDPYYTIVSKVFQEASQSCHDTIRDSWQVIDKFASQKDGLSHLAKIFKTCKPLDSSSDLKHYLASLYCEAAQYNRPPEYLVTEICNAIDNDPTGVDIPTRIHAGVVAYKGEKSCYDINEFNLPTDTNVGWDWQTCTDLIDPSSGNINNTMLDTWSYDLHDITVYCQDTYGITLIPRPHWIETEFGGYDMKQALQNFGSNIIFSNGLKDPWSATGVLESISNTVVAIHTAKGSHCLDTLAATYSDPDWLIDQRNSEVGVMKKWVTEYYSIHGIKNISRSNHKQGCASTFARFLLICFVVVLCWL